jgi:hypothetical protein
LAAVFTFLVVYTWSIKRKYHAGGISRLTVRYV